MDKKLIARYAVREILSILGMGVALFWSAGKMDWWPAWAALAVSSAWLAGTAYVILRFNPDLLAELTGYEDYNNQVRYRLLPGIW